ncbi:MAG: ImmA/IrrE family metallo-endopeptidase [Polyangiales bacterium]
MNRADFSNTSHAHRGSLQGEARRREVKPRWQLCRERGASADDILQMFMIRTPPVPVLKILRGLDIDVRALDHDPGWDGAVDGSAEPATIWYSRAVAPVRQRFTLAHELGHLLLHPLTRTFRDRTNEASVKAHVQERQADSFAAELLMPSWLLTRFVEVANAETKRLAALFQVSRAAMARRLITIYGPHATREHSATSPHTR